MRIMTLACVCVFSVFALEAALTSVAAADPAAVAMDAPLPSPDKDPGARSARAIECAQKADARGLQGKPRKHFLHECKSGR